MIIIVVVIKPEATATIGSAHWPKSLATAHRSERPTSTCSGARGVTWGALEGAVVGAAAEVVRAATVMVVV